MKKLNRKNNHGVVDLLNSSRNNQTSEMCKEDVSDSSKNQISKYFSKHANQNKKSTLSSSSSPEIDSPYRNIISEPKVILNDSLQDENDFKTPKSIKFPIKATNLKDVPSKKVARRRIKSRKPSSKGIQKTITRMLEDNLSHSDTNPEHLQMALALSKSEQSTLDEEDTEGNNDKSYNFPSTQERILNIRQTLEQFGFKSNKVASKKSEFTRTLPKKSKYKYITPILFLRTEDDRQSLINNKISRILSQNSLTEYNYSNNEENKIKSKYLFELICPESRIFRWASMQHCNINIEDYYLKHLKMEVNRIKCGYHLKDWSKIPGRERTPPRDITKRSREIIELNKVENISQKEIDRVNCNLEFENNEKVIEIDAVINVEDSNEKEVSKIQENAYKSNETHKLSDRAMSPDIFSSEDEDIVEINKSITEKLEASLRMLEDIKRFNISRKSTSQNESKTISTPKKEKLDTRLISSPIIISDNEIEPNTEGINDDNSLETSHLVEDKSKNENNSEKQIETSNHLDTEYEHVDTTFTNLEFELEEVKQKETTAYPPIIFKSRENETNTDIIQINRNQLNDSDDMLATLEITFSSKTTQNITPRNTHYDGQSASLLSNFESLNKHSNNSKNITSDESICEDKFETINGIEHFESFSKDLDTSDDKIYDLTQSDEELNENKSMAQAKNESNINESEINKENEICDIGGGSLNDTNYIKGMLNESSFVFKGDGKSKSHEVIFDKTLNKDVSSAKKSEVNERKYEVLSDSDNTILYEFENSKEWKLQYKNSRISELLEKSVCSENELPDVNFERKSNKIRKSLSFSLENNYDSSCVFKRYATFSTPTGNKSKPVDNEYILQKHPSVSSVSSETPSEDGIICISDEELNYSSVYSTPYNKINKTKTSYNDISAINKNNTSSAIRNEDIESNAIMNEDIESNAIANEDFESYSYLEKYYDDNCVYFTQNTEENNKNVTSLINSPLTHPRVLQLSNKKPLKNVNEEINTKHNPSTSQTPKSDKIDNASTPDGYVVIKMKNVTPMPDYDQMNTPKITKELEKIGVKQLKRHRGVQILKHIYETTHPILDNEREIHEDDSDDNKNIKRRRLTKSKSRRNLQLDEEIAVGITNFKSINNCNVEIIGDIPESENLVFERKASKKISSCAVPLHIAWHNLISSNPQLKENILLYEPLQLEVLYLMLKEQGYKYHIQDLLTFLDKKCITIRTNQNTGQNRRKRR